MTEIWTFLFSLGLGIAARFLYMLASLVSKRTDLLPVTFILDLLTVCAVGAGFTLYVVMTGAALAPYMFAALAGGYYLTYKLTAKKAR